MTHLEAINEARRLMHKWVSHREIGYDLDRIHASIRQELQWNRELPARCTEACKRETRGDAILLGKVRKALAQ